jgi:hypothetical protein
MYAERYQWIKGDKAGNVEQYSSHDNDWVYFQGGSRISAQLITEYMIQVDANTPLDLSITKSQPVTNKKQVQAEVKRRDEFNPVKSLLKQAAKNKQQFSYRFDIDIPKQQVYTLIKDSFESDVDELLVEMVMSNVDKNELYDNVRKQLKEQILKIYNNGKQSESREPGSNEEPVSGINEQETSQIVP